MNRICVRYSIWAVPISGCMVGWANFWLPILNRISRTHYWYISKISNSLFRWSYSHIEIMLLCVQKKYYYSVLLNFRHSVRTATILLFNTITSKITTWSNFTGSQQHKRDWNISFSACKYEFSSWFLEKSHSDIQTPDSLQ